MNPLEFELVEHSNVRLIHKPSKFLFIFGTHAPYLWASLPQENELLSIDPAEAVNTPFTADEQVQIKKTIEEIRAYITSTYTNFHLYHFE